MYVHVSSLSLHGPFAGNFQDFKGRYFATLNFRDLGEFVYTSFKVI